MILYNNNFIRGVKMKSQNNEFENEKNKTVTESLKSNKSKKTTNDTIDAKSSDKKNVNKNTNTNPKNSKKKKDKMDKKEKISKPQKVHSSTKIETVSLEEDIKPEKVSENSDSNTTLDKTLKDPEQKNAGKKRGRPRNVDISKTKYLKVGRYKQAPKVTNDDVKRVFESKLRKKRLVLGLTQIEMADKIGMSVDFYRDIESGRNTGSIATMLNLCNVLKIPPDQFFEDLLNDLKKQSRDYNIQQYFSNFSNKDRLALKRLIIYMDRYYNQND